MWLLAQNHDTGSTQNHWPFPSQYLHQVRSQACMLLCRMLFYMTQWMQARMQALCTFQPCMQCHVHTDHPCKLCTVLFPST